MDVNRRILMAMAEVDVWVLAARRVGVIVALLVGAAAVLCGVAWITGRGRERPMRWGPLPALRGPFPRGEGFWGRRIATILCGTGGGPARARIPY